MAELGRFAGMSKWADGRLRAMVDRMPPELGRHLLFLESQHRWGNFRNPRGFSEKINWRVLFDRRALIGATCDKLQTKSRAQALGLDVPETVWVGEDVRELVGLSLPKRWVLKPNHGSGLVHFGVGRIDNVSELVAATRDWLELAAYRQRYEWAYSTARKVLLVEAMVVEHGAPPPDYKFFTFDGEPSVVSRDDGRFTQHRRRFYSETWQPLLVQSGGGMRRRPLAEPVSQPSTLAQMKEVCRTIAEGFDFVRVDLYSVENRVFVGELTPYPGGGLARFWPYEFDLELGRRWTLPRIPVG